MCNIDFVLVERVCYSGSKEKAAKGQEVIHNGGQLFNFSMMAKLSWDRQRDEKAQKIPHEMTTYTKNNSANLKL